MDSFIITWDWAEAKTVFVGRNGSGHCAGVEIQLNNKVVDLCPLTSKGQLGNCHINLPMEAIPDLVRKLQSLLPKKKTRHRVWIVWGEDQTIAENGKNAINEYEYEFDTAAELNAFLLGVDETQGGTNYNQFDTKSEATAYIRECIQNAEIEDYKDHKRGLYGKENE